MRIAVIHSFYRSAVSSGENNTVLAQVEALRGAGHEVELIAQYTDENRKRNPLYPLKAGFDVATGNGYDPTPELEKFQPDVVWVHNLFPNFSTRWLAKWRGPLIATLHNYRAVCANGVLFRDGHVCTLCPDGRPLSSVKYGCYKNSRLATIPLALQISKGLSGNPLISRANKIIVLSLRALRFYSALLSKDEKLVLLQNFVPEFKPKEDCQKSDCWVVASRLSREKGIRALVENWPRGLRLDIYGEGEDSVPIRTMRKPGVRLRGQITRDRLVGELSGYAGLVFPSLWFEGNPSIVLEAFQAGIPVVAKQGSSGADIVVEHGAGKVYSDERIDLHWALIQAAQQAEDLGTRGRDAYSTFFSSEVWCVHAEALMATIVNTKT